MVTITGKEEEEEVVVVLGWGGKESGVSFGHTEFKIQST